MADQPPHRLIFIRHAEKPHDAVAFTDEMGHAAPESLIPLGWQRAGALVELFGRQDSTASLENLTLDVIYAAGVGEGSRSKRSPADGDAARPAAGAAWRTVITTYLKDDHAGLAADVATQTGVVLIAWKHNRIPAIAALLVPGGNSPKSWPDRFDLMWICDRIDNGWSCSVRHQALLSGNELEPAH
ncbi:hypothetical protein [Sphingomonas sp. PAMC 26617]|uniref:hypothetical protein n=1 Tax=Sphingomonas sp. PAMC 26617 TaxID=1112216 RepID=UPI0002885F23|nr:hypothetical protein [Sphingomonas sp. PAMC 26617]